MSVKDKARDAVIGPVAERLQGDRPGPVGAAAGATVAGAVTGLFVFRLLRGGGEDADDGQNKN
jgi:hypothetical protein